MATNVSKAVLCKWATDVCGSSVGKQLALEKQLSNGAIYCQLMESAVPGSINMAKVNLAADADYKALPNFKLLEAALHKAGMEQPLDVPMLSKATWATHYALLNQIYALAPPGTPALAGRVAMRQIDGNSLDDQGSRGAGKRGGSKRQLLGTKRPADEVAGAAEEAAAAEAAEAALAAAPSAEADELRAQLEQMRLDLDTSRAEAHSLREEADFYIAKLELIEEACVRHPPAEVGAAVLGVLHSSEDDHVSAA